MSTSLLTNDPNFSSTFLRINVPAIVKKLAFLEKQLGLVIFQLSFWFFMSLHKFYSPLMYASNTCEYYDWKKIFGILFLNKSEGVVINIRSVSVHQWNKKQLLLAVFVINDSGFHETPHALWGTILYNTIRKQDF